MFIIEKTKKTFLMGSRRGVEPQVLVQANPNKQDRTCYHILMHSICFS